MTANVLAKIQTVHLLNIHCRPLLYTSLLDGRGGVYVDCKLISVQMMKIVKSMTETRS